MAEITWTKNSYKQNQVEIGDEYSGIQVTYCKSRNELSFFGWYDHYVGIEGGTISVPEFMEKLGIKPF